MQQSDGNRHDGQRPTFLDAPNVVFDEPGFLAVTWKNIGIVIWRTRATLPHVDKLERFADDLLAQNPNGISAIHIVTPAASLPESAARAELDRLTKKYSSNLGVMATVIEGSGFWASAMTSFVTGLHWMSRRPFHARTASDAADIAAWAPVHHTAKTGVRVTTPELSRALAWARERSR